MARTAFTEILNHLQSTGFTDIAGTRIAADVPLSERLINEFVAASLPPTVPVREVSIRPEAGNRFSVRITPKAGLIPPLTLRLEIEQQPDMPHAPILALRMKTMGGLFGLATAALPIGSMLPPGVRLEGERILVDLRAIAAQKGFADFIRYVTALRVTSEDGRVLLHVNAGV